MSGRKDDPDLAPDAALAKEIEDPEALRKEQLAYYGGDDDDIDDFDPTGLDDGSDLNAAPAASSDDDDTQSGDEDTQSEDDDDAEDTADDADDSDDSDDDDSSDDGDEDSADEDEDDDGDSEEDEEEEAPAPKGIPKHRFDEVNERRKAAEEENARLRAQIEAGKPPAEDEKPYDFDAAEKEYVELTLDGDVDGALAKRKEIRAAEHAEWKAEAKQETKTDISQDAETQELLAMSKEAEQMFDVFNPDSEHYNQQMLDKVLTFMGGYEAANPNMSRGDAFVAGLADVVEMYDLMPEEGEGEGDPEPKPTGKKKVDKKKAKLREKAHQPAGLEGQGSADVGAAVPDIENMTDEEIDALPDKTLARMRGDFV